MPNWYTCPATSCLLAISNALSGQICKSLKHFCVGTNERGRGSETRQAENCSYTTVNNPSASRIEKLDKVGVCAIDEKRLNAERGYATALTECAVICSSSKDN
jgi:hypothetical protein